MSVDSMRDVTNIWREVRNWPPGQRVALATRILQSLQQEEASVSVSQERREALNQLIGVWKTDPPPTDDQVERIIDEERMQKYG